MEYFGIGKAQQTHKSQHCQQAAKQSQAYLRLDVIKAPSKVHGQSPQSTLNTQKKKIVLLGLYSVLIMGNGSGDNVRGPTAPEKRNADKI